MCYNFFRCGETMIISATDSLAGKVIKEYRGIVFGEAITGMDFLKDFTANISDTIGGRASEYEQELVDARGDAINEMMTRAKKIGANALLGVKIDVETIGQKGSMIMVSASGTAVVVE